MSKPRHRKGEELARGHTGCDLCPGDQPAAKASKPHMASAHTSRGTPVHAETPGVTTRRLGDRGTRPTQASSFRNSFLKGTGLQWPALAAGLGWGNLKGACDSTARGWEWGGSSRAVGSPPPLHPPHRALGQGQTPPIHTRHTLAAESRGHAHPYIPEFQPPPKGPSHRLPGRS